MTWLGESGYSISEDHLERTHEILEDNKRRAWAKRMKKAIAAGPIEVMEAPPPFGTIYVFGIKRADFTKFNLALIRWEEKVTIRDENWLTLEKFMAEAEAGNLPRINWGDEEVFDSDSRRLGKELSTGFEEDTEDYLGSYERSEGHLQQMQPFIDDGEKN